VVGVSDDRYGERVLAVVVPRTGMTLDLAGVREHFAGAGSSRRHVPELLDVVDALPRGATGKVQRGQLREQWSPS
jgi:fatty-acyl-CoA synthase